MATMSTSTITATSPTAAATTSAAANNNNRVNNNPLLFFVALGFGVLFTNLWIIIGVKYCFRYQNARRRGVPMHGEGMAMGAMHNGRRRREKKLMTMEEVESQFPQMTYKSWRAQRERQGLSTEGGVQTVSQEEAQNAREVLSGQVAPSRAPSIRTVRSRRGSQGSIEPQDASHTGVFEVGTDAKRDIALEDIDITEAVSEKPGSKGSTLGKRSSMTVERELHETHAPRLSTSSKRPIEEEEHVERTSNAEDEIDETQIAHLPEDIGSGDTCAICIDQLEEDDEVRGLTCGHAFHCSCVDVWLTTRRAICPLCKKDYWVRKTPVEPVEPQPPMEVPTWREYLLGQIIPSRRRAHAAAVAARNAPAAPAQDAPEVDLERGEGRRE